MYVPLRQAFLKKSLELLWDIKQEISSDMTSDKYFWMVKNVLH